MLTEWKERPLQALYPFVWLDAIHYKVKEDGRYISKAFYTILGEKLVYKVETKESSELNLDKLEEKWGKKYNLIIKSWRNNWDNLFVYFAYPKAIRKVIYTTNIIESVHRQFRTLTKTKGAFPNDNSLLKLLYMGIKNAENEVPLEDKNGQCLYGTGVLPSLNWIFFSRVDWITLFKFYPFI